MPRMLAVLTEPVQVELVDHSHWWIPYLVPLAVVLAGVIAAGLSWLIHRQSVEAEDRRLQRRFAHERRMRERDATRATLDDVVKVIIRTNEELAEFASRVIELEGVRAEIEQARERGDESELNALGLRLRDAQLKVN